MFLAVFRNLRFFLTWNWPRINSTWIILPSSRYWRILLLLQFRLHPRFTNSQHSAFFSPWKLSALFAYWNTEYVNFHFVSLCYYAKETFSCTAAISIPSLKFTKNHVWKWYTCTLLNLGCTYTLSLFFSCQFAYNNNSK